jgi:hypothetical protein
VPVRAAFNTLNNFLKVERFQDNPIKLKTNEGYNRSIPANNPVVAPIFKYLAWKPRKWCEGQNQQTDQELSQEFDSLNFSEGKRKIPLGMSVQE